MQPCGRADPRPLCPPPRSASSHCLVGRGARGSESTPEQFHPQQINLLCFTTWSLEAGTSSKCEMIFSQSSSRFLNSCSKTSAGQSRSSQSVACKNAEMETIALDVIPTRWSFCLCYHVLNVGYGSSLKPRSLPSCKRASKIRNLESLTSEGNSFVNQNEEYLTS